MPGRMSARRFAVWSTGRRKIRRVLDLKPVSDFRLLQPGSRTFKQGQVADDQITVREHSRESSVALAFTGFPFRSSSSRPGYAGPGAADQRGLATAISLPNHEQCFALLLAQLHWSHLGLVAGLRWTGTA